MKEKERIITILHYLIMTFAQSGNAGLPCMNFLRMAAMPILERLHLEERLLRTSTDNWCIVNDGTNHLAIVMAYGSLWVKLCFIAYLFVVSEFF